ncbi:MAG: GAF domain-containing protein [Pseudolabrys sp.]|nr:GAF domain-containing protein [Pseudolabrys sp.]
MSTTRPSPTPAFGQADLSNCEREQIHLAASIQPHGALLVVRTADGIVIQSSANASEFLDLDRPAVGCNIHEFGGLAEHVAPYLTEPPDGHAVMTRCKVGRTAGEFDVLVHSLNGGLVVELERASPPVDLSQPVETALKGIVSSTSLRGLCEQTASIFKSLTGYDRVMVYRFDEDGHGEVFSERKEAHLEAFLGNRYPASDIPQIARRLYEQTRVRVLVDVAYKPVPLVPRLCPLSGQDLDMSLCFLRSMSPIHIQYLKNMGVGATLVASLVVGGKLWGLVACHHYSPWNIPFESRAACELLVEAISTRIAALESVALAQAEISVRRLEQRMIEAISQDGDWRIALFDNSQALLQPVGAHGGALLFEGQIQTAGDVPGTQQLRDIARWLDEQPRQPVIATAALGHDEPRFAPLVAVASGLLAAPVSSTRGEYLIWFRPELVRMLTWGGDPSEPVIIGNDPSDLSPRRSFAKWHQLVEGKADPWTPADITVAKLIGETVSDVVLQFRSVRMLIAKDQFENVTQQVQTSDIPVVVADPRGRILLQSQQFESLLPAGHRRLETIQHLADLFVDSAEAKRRLRELVDFRRTWRGELTMRMPTGEPVSVLVRGDPVFSSPDRVLGIVLLFTDVTDRKTVEAAGREFQNSVIERHRVPGINLGTKADLIHQRLYSSVVENAQLAALEITDGTDKARMLRMLDSVRSSMSRTAEILDRLIRRTMRGRD